MEVNRKSVLCMISKRFNLRRDNLENRLKLQKTVYLLQAYGLQLGYGFGWYKYGPYSQDLVRDAYTVLRSEEPSYEAGTNGWEFADATEAKLGQFREAFGDILDDPGELELLASAHFVYTTWCEGNIEAEGFVEEFKKCKRRLFGQQEQEIEASRIREALEKARTLVREVSN